MVDLVYNLCSKVTKTKTFKYIFKSKTKSKTKKHEKAFILTVKIGVQALPEKSADDAVVDLGRDRSRWWCGRQRSCAR